MKKWKNLKLLLICITVMIYFISLYFPQSRQIYNLSIEQSRDHDYYDDLKIKEEAPNFQIKSYDMKLQIKHQLKIEGKMHLVFNHPVRYAYLTLHHAYHLRFLNKEIKDVFQDHDYYKIMFHKDIQDLELNFIEEGYHDVFYTNKEACFLPGAFTWYPIAGKQKLYETNSIHTMVTPKYIQKSHYKIYIDANKEIITNLKYNQDGIFSGDVQRVSLLYGHTQKESGMITNSYNLDLSNEKELIPDYLKFQKQLKTVFSYDKILPKQIIIVPLSLYYNTESSVYLFDDHILMTRYGVNLTSYMSSLNYKNPIISLRDFVDIDYYDIHTPKQFWDNVIARINLYYGYANKDQTKKHLLFIKSKVMQLRQKYGDQELAKHFFLKMVYGKDALFDKF